ncbi:MAG: hypothetical protein ABII09_02905 [Planctomycetota bacterium]
MPFRFYSSILSQASRRVAGGILTTGLALISFGLLIYLLPRVFATLAAMFFFITGAGACITAAKIFMAQRRIDKEINDKPNEYRQNVKIKIEQ